MRLRRQEIVIAASPELCFEVVAAAGRRLEKRSETEWLVEFVTNAGGREFKTVEVLNLERPTAIHYRWVEGPLPDVRETIRFTPVGDGQSKLIYTGSITVGRGPLGWVVARFRVKPLFDRLVKEHLDQAKEVAEKRAARTKVHARTKTQPWGNSDAE